jgi:hypothetical protein
LGAKQDLANFKNPDLTKKYGESVTYKMNAALLSIIFKFKWPIPHSVIPNLSLGWVNGFYYNPKELLYAELDHPPYSSPMNILSTDDKFNYTMQGMVGVGVDFVKWEITSYRKIAGLEARYNLPFFKVQGLTDENSPDIHTSVFTLSLILYAPLNYDR